MAQTNANLIWKIAHLLRGLCQPNQYGEASQGPARVDGH
jgi:type I restriction enzyme M protein